MKTINEKEKKLTDVLNQLKNLEILNPDKIIELNLASKKKCLSPIFSNS